MLVILIFVLSLPVCIAKLAGWLAGTLASCFVWESLSLSFSGISLFSPTSLLALGFSFAGNRASVHPSLKSVHAMRLLLLLLHASAHAIRGLVNAGRKKKKHKIPSVDA